MFKFVAPKRSRRTGAVITSGVVVAVALAFQVQASSASDDRPGVEGVFEAAMVAEQNFDAVYPSADEQPDQTLELDNLGDKAVLAKLPDQATVSRQDQAAKDILSELFAGDQLKFEEGALADALRTRSDVEYTYSGGADSFKYSGVSIDGQVAKVSATVRTWKTLVHQGNGYMDIVSPSNVIEVDAVLEKRDETWKITDLTWDFAPGEAP